MKTTPHHSGLQQGTSRNRLLKLEPRLLFDAAALLDLVTAEATADRSIPAEAPVAEASRTTAQAVDVIRLDNANAETTPNLATAEREAGKLVADFLQRPDARELLFALFNGGQSEPSAEWLQAADSFLAAVRNGEVTVRVELRSSAELQGARGAFSATGTTGECTIYLNADWLAGNPAAEIGPADSASVTRVLVEELGHFLDSALNSAADTSGDEGEAFAYLLANGTLRLEPVTSLVDGGTIAIDGQSVAVEFANFAFVNAYEMVYDLNNNGSVVGSTGETAAEKEQSTHNFNAAGLGQVTINDDTNSNLFSGNDVSAIGINIGSNTYYGWISRPIKSGGIVRGFYFWTDSSFTNLAQAQADGNQDGDSDVTDNRGFVLVVDQAWFTTQIAATSTTVATAIDNTSLRTYSRVGSSSDRVDSALNALVTSNVAPVANNDTASGTPGTTGGAALEQGYNSNTSTVITATLAATGNVLTNDTDANPDTLSVSKVVSKNTGSSALPSGSGAFTVAGTYGTLTIYANGSYSYAVDNSQATVNALLAGNISEAFTYTASDGKGGTASATLTVQINGSNDAPVAVNDYNVAKEITTASNTGFTATGNVLTNDSDVDSGDTKTIQGIAISGAATVGTVSANAGSASLSFTGDTGFTSVSSAQELYVSVGGTYRAVYASDGVTQIAVSTKLESPAGSNNWVITLSASPGFYFDAGGNQAISNMATFFSTNTAVLFENSTATTENTSGGKTATVAVAQSTGFTTLTNLSGLTGTIAVGMTVTGTGITQTTRVSEITYTGGVLTSIKLDQVLTGTTSGSYTFAGSGTLSQALQGAHGTLTLASGGGYTYTPTTDNPNLSSGQSAIEVFDYTLRDAAGVTSAAKLYITVYGSGTNDPDLTDDTRTATESGVTAGGNTATAGSDATGFVLANDKESAAAAANVIGTAYVSRAGLQGTGTYSTIDTGDGRTTQQSGTVTGAYGTLTINDLGAYTYAINNGNAAVNALLPGQTLTETFLYEVKNTLSSSGPNWASLVVTIQGTNDRPVAVADTAAVTEDRILTATGNVLTNDTDVDAGDTKVVSNVIAGSATPTTAVTVGTTSANGVVVAGTYGNLTIGADGTYSYVLATSGAQYTALQALAEGVVQNEVFTYEVKDGSSGTQTSTLTIAVTGTNEAPINQFNGTAISATTTTAVTTTVNTPIDFTGSKLLSVADGDTNLTTITLVVEHGALSFTSVPSVVTLSASSGTSITLSAGTQAELNAALALLRYTPDSGYTGTDFLTILSRDGTNALDSDGIAINIPTNTNATVSEPALGTGSNAASGAETASGSLSLGGGQSVLVQQSGNIVDGSNNPIGTWQVNTDGTFSVTLTAASSATSTSFSYAVTDSFGNTINNTVTVAITDDGPTATANTKSVNEGSTTTGNVLSDGTADAFGADGAKTTAPVGGLVGVRAAVGDTTTAVTTGAGTPITGTYGTLTLNANGSYSYVANSNSVTTAQDDVFVYTIEDADGTRSTATLTITVNDSSTDTLSVTGQGPVNEGSDYALFTVVGSGSQTINLAVTNGTATLTAPVVQYSTDGTTWTTYTWNGTSGDRPTGGTVYVRVSIASELDTVYEGSETFSLVATNSINSAITDTASTSIIDDGTGTKYGPNATDTSTAALDNDKPQMAIGNVSVEEGSKAIFNVTVGEAAAPYTVTFGTSLVGQSGEAGDFSSTLVVKIGGTVVTANGDGSYTIPAGTTALTVEVSTNNDGIYEGSETFLLTGKTEFMGSNTSGSGTITDDGSGSDGDDSGTTVDNDKPQMAIGNVSVEEGSKAIFNVTVGEAAAPYTVTFGTSLVGQSGEAGDFSSTLVVKIGGTVVTANGDGSYTIPAGTTALTVEVSTNNDGIYEGSETFLLTGKTEFMGSNTSGSGTITDDGSGSDGDDSGTTVDNDKPQMAIGNVSVEEGSKAIFNVTVGEAAAPYTVTFGTSLVGQSGEAGDFSSTLVVKIGGTVVTANGDGSYTIPPGTTALTVEVSTIDDTDFEGSETFLLTGKTEFMGSDTSGTGSITDDGSGSDGDDSGTDVDDDRTIGVTAAGPVNEGSTYAMFSVTGQAGYSVTLALGNTASGADTDATTTGFTYQYSVNGGTSWVDYTWNGSTGNRPTMPAGGVLQVRVAIASEADAPYEGAETFELRASYSNNPANAASAATTIIDDGTGNRYTGAIGAGPSFTTDNTNLDNDLIPPVTVSSPNVNEASPYAVFTVGGTPGQTVSLSLGGGTAGTAGVDYGTTGPGNLEYSLDGGTTWLDYSTNPNPVFTGSSMLVRTPITNDGAPDSGETFNLTATPLGGSAVAGTATIRDDGTGDIFKNDGTPDAAAPKNNDAPVLATPVPNPPTPPIITPVDIPVTQVAAPQFTPDISAYVLAAVTDAQQQGAQAGMSGVLPNLLSAIDSPVVGRGLGMDLALHVLPAVAGVASDVSANQRVIQIATAGVLGTGGDSGFLSTRPLAPAAARPLGLATNGETNRAADGAPNGAAAGASQAPRPDFVPADELEDDAAPAGERPADFSQRADPAALAASGTPARVLLANRSFSEQIRLAAEKYKLPSATDASRTDAAPRRVA